jgi:uncharacterized protein
LRSAAGADDANLWLQDEVTIVARRVIAQAEELTLDYALTTVEPYWQLDQPCHCGTAACRYIVTGNDWQLPDVQQRYQGHFAPFIQEQYRINSPKKDKWQSLLRKIAGPSNVPV